MPNVTMIYPNYDRLLHEDCKEEFPDAVIKGTLFSYCNHIVNESLIRLRGVNILRKDEIIQKMCALPLLPPEQITICYRKIRESIPQEEQQSYDEFFNLFAEKWMEGVGPVNFSNYNDLKSLQDVERSTFNIFSNYWYSNKHGNNDIWKILRYNQYVAYGAESNLKKLDEGKDPCNKNCPTSHLILQGGKPDIEKLWRKFLNDTFDIDHILRCLRLQVRPCYDILNNSDQQRIRCSVLLIDNVQQQAQLQEEDNDIVMLDHDYLQVAAVEEVERHANEDDVIAAHDICQPLDEAANLDAADNVIANDVNVADDVGQLLAEAANPDAADAVNPDDVIAAHVVDQPLAEAARVVAGDLSEDDDQIGINVNDDFDFLADARNEGYRRIAELEARGFTNLRYIGSGRVISVRREDDHEAIEEEEGREEDNS
ncbi:uncharacterized protein LOC123272704 isoform X2 [Cotesia glomerata]|uniref:uncharacterized protein LOC123272704 isoform X2 n=1 Tax=Cotesia glomerata TaxID=32391 RepID=UPI001D032E12|nr:uncharacterized protein LOC123272704 isoform X2 [Cotesia glomerata]